MEASFYSHKERESIMESRINPKFRDREFNVIIHVSAFIAGDICGYGACVSIAPAKRKIIYGTVDKTQSKAVAIYAELTAIDKAIDVLIENNVRSARFKVSMKKTIDALTGIDVQDSCLMLVRQIIVKTEDRDYTYGTEETSTTSASYQTARRAAGSFDYKNDYKWRPECSEKISGLYQFCIQEFYTRKQHEDWEYLHLAYMQDQYHGPRHGLSLPLGARKTVDLWSSDKEKQDIAAMFYHCGMNATTACKCAGCMIKFPTEEDMRRELRMKIKVLVNRCNHEMKKAKLGDTDIELATDRVLDRYYEGHYPLRTLEEGVLDVFLETIDEIEAIKSQGERQRPEGPKRKQVYIAGKRMTRSVTRKCAFCGKDIDSLWECKDLDIANILKRQGLANAYCSMECFAMAAKLMNIQCG